MSLAASNLISLLLRQTGPGFSVAAKNTPTSEATLESRPAASLGPDFSIRWLSRLVTHSFGSHLDSFNGLVVPAASGLEIKIPQNAGACEAAPTRRVGAGAGAVIIWGKNSPLRAAAAALHSRVSQGLPICQGRHLSQPFVTSPGIHRPWGWPKAGQARALCQQAAQEATLSTVLWQLSLAGAKDRIRCPRPTAGARNLAERLARALTTTGP